MVQGAQRGLFSALSFGPASMVLKWQPSIPSTDLFLKMITEIPHLTSYVKSLRLSCSLNRTKLHYQQLAKALMSISHLTNFAFCLSRYIPEQILESDLSYLIQTSLTLPTLRHLELVDVPMDLFPYNTALKHWTRSRYSYNQLLTNHESIHATSTSRCEIYRADWV
jgi:hypothetical protein